MYCGRNFAFDYYSSDLPVRGYEWLRTEIARSEMLECRLKLVAAGKRSGDGCFSSPMTSMSHCFTPEGSAFQMKRSKVH